MNLLCEMLPQMSKHTFETCNLKIVETNLPDAYHWY